MQRSLPPLCRRFLGLLILLAVALPAFSAPDKAKKSNPSSQSNSAKSTDSEKPQDPSDTDTTHPDGTPKKVKKTEAEWRRQLSPMQFKVTRKKGTEIAGTGKYAFTKKDGIYRCVCCGQPLFDSKTKFDSGTGWPSFYQPLSEEAVNYLDDETSGELRIEVECSRCDAHLGHVFDDGPQPTGKRFCMNSAALNLISRDALEKEKEKALKKDPKNKTAPKDKAGDAKADIDRKTSKDD